MLFNSIIFAVFLPITFSLYWLIPRHLLVVQNSFLLLASYVFYGWWDIRFLLLIIASSLVDFFVGIWLHKTKKERSRRFLLGTSIVFNLGILGFFKYCDFFVDSFITAWQTIGVNLEPSTLGIILPVGISFYTFQTMTYTIDIYRKNLEPTRDPIAFFAFVAFFPQLVAGPIERASNLLPQFLSSRTFLFAKAQDGLRQILWGLFKKIVIADTIALYVNEIFASPENFSGSTLALGSVLFAVQIYCDFSGYTDIAIGTARLFGFNLMQNFNYPYFAKNIADFWRRWHISLSTWFRDYVYIPLGGSYGSVGKKIRNVLIVFVVSGLWHGANWTFVVWGGLHALFFLPLLLSGKNKDKPEEQSTGFVYYIRTGFSILITFAAVCFAWIFFRAESITQALHYIYLIAHEGILSVPILPKVSAVPFMVSFLLMVILFTSEWFSQHKPHPLHDLGWNKVIRLFIYFSLASLVCLFAAFTPASEFIYFQF